MVGKGEGCEGVEGKVDKKFKIDIFFYFRIVKYWGKILYNSIFYKNIIMFY